MIRLKKESFCECFRNLRERERERERERKGEMHDLPLVEGTHDILFQCTHLIRVV
jgi:hypothetical protein